MTVPEKKLVKFKLNGKDVEAAEGSLVIDTARREGVAIPHYCYHPELGNPGNCRMCLVEVEGAPKPMASCRLSAKEGMVVRSDTDVIKRAQASTLELHLVNHPLDCPVCDQAGECGLQDYYMKYGRYESQVCEDKLHKKKRVEAGPHVMLDQERCVLCTRCTRFVDDVTKTHELGIFGRGHSERVDLTPGATLDNAYSGNVIDICPVGALTDRDFRFKVRVWYLDKTDSVCPGCARACSISVHTNVKRPWHNDGRRVARIKPRRNDDVNGFWICDDGRYGFKHLDEDRMGRVMRLAPARKELAWDGALDAVADALKKGVSEHGSAGLVVAASGMLSNEDWTAFKSLFVDTLGVTNFFFTPEPDQVGVQDDLLRRREKVPNLKGGEVHGFGTTIKSMTLGDLTKGLQEKKYWGVYMIERDLTALLGDKGAELLSSSQLRVLQTPFAGKSADAAHFRLPATAYVEEDGHFTNFEGKVQAYKKALEPLGAAKPDWWIFDAVRAVYAASTAREAAAK